MTSLHAQVHPDLFDSQPEARDVNSENLSILTGLTDSLASSEELGTGGGDTSCNLSFYISQKHADEAVGRVTGGDAAAAAGESGDDKDKDDEGKGLALIRAKLPARSPDEGSRGSTRYLGMLHAALQSLFQQAGLDPDFVWGEEFAAGASGMDGLGVRSYEFGEDTLLGYLERVHQLCMLRMERAREQAQRIHILTIALRSVGFRTMFDPRDAVSAGANQESEQAYRYACLSHLRRLIDDASEEGDGFGIWTSKMGSDEASSPNASSAPPNRPKLPTLSAADCESLRGRVIIFSKRAKACSIDGMGRIVLPSSGLPEVWVAALSDPAFVRESRRRSDVWAAAVDRQKRVAEQIGLSHVFSETDIASQREYLDFLDRLEASAGPIRSFLSERPGYGTVPIRVHAQTQKPPFAIDKDLGVLGVPVDCDVDRLLHFLDSRGTEAKFIHDRYTVEEKERDGNLLKVKRGLKLSGLRRGAGAADHQYADCCKRLAWIPYEDAYVFENLQLVVCDTYEVMSDGEVRIEWNWR